MSSSGSFHPSQDAHTQIDLFAGIGGFSLAGGWAGFETVAFVENNPFKQRVLRKNFGQGIRIHGDIRTFDATGFRGVDLATGGFPCQDVSGADSAAAGIFGGRSGLWFEMLRVVHECRPRVVVVENSHFLRVRGADRVLFGLEGAGYTCRSFVVSAGAAGAPHIRQRAILVAYSAHFSGDQADSPADAMRGQDGAHSERGSIHGSPSARGQWQISGPQVFGVDAGLPNRLDRARAVGDSVNPYQVFPILSAIAQSLNEQKAGRSGNEGFGSGVVEAKK